MKKPSKTKTLFKGKESSKEELTEAKAIKSGKLTPKQYAMGEKSEGKAYKKGGKTKCYADGGRARMGEDGSYSMGKPPSLSEAMSDNDDRLSGRNASMTLPGQSRPANRATTGGSGYKPYTGSSVSSASPTKSSMVSDVLSQYGKNKTRNLTAELNASKKASAASEEAPTPKVSAPTPKPTTKKASPTPVKRKPSGGISAADLESFRQENMADRAKYGFGDVDSGDELPVGADAYKKGGKTKCMKGGGNVRGHGAERTGRTRGRFI